MRDVDPDTLARLLDLQGEDTAIRRLEHRRETLPEAQRLARVNDQLAELQADIEIATKQHDEIAREQNRLEGEIELAGQKIEREEKRLFSGGVSNPKELSALQAEVAMLKKQRSGLEDGLLEVMEQREQAESTLQQLNDERDEAARQAGSLQTVVDSLTSEIDSELDEHRARRSEIAPSLPEQLLALYEQLRASKGGVGAAALDAGVCQGCHTRLPAKEVERVKAEGGVQRCDNCRRILVP